MESPEEEKKWLISFNPRLIDKIPPEHKESFSTGFETFEVSADDFEEVVSKGISFSYLFEDGVRKTQNFILSDCLCADVDGGLTLQDAMQHTLVSRYASFIYTTPSHSEDIHRFRVVFLLDESIEDPEILSGATRALAKMLGGDLSVADAARLFYGNSGAKLVHLGNTMPPAVVNELAAEGIALAHQKKRLAFTGTASSTFTEGTVFTTESGEQITADQITDKTVVRCPFHLDQTPSSFLALNRNQDVYHYCSVCCVTRWVPKSIQPGIPLLDDFIDTMRALSKQSNLREFKQKQVGLEQFMDLEKEILPAVEFTESKYLPDFEIPQGLVLVRSPKGSGKTEFVKREVHRLKNRHQTFEDFEESAWDDDCRIYTNTTILLIGHRQALIGEMCSRIGLHSYLDDHSHSDGEQLERTKRYGICLDSLQKVRDKHYDVVIIDEVQQVLAHFLSDTLRGKRSLIWESFSRLIRSAKKIIALDADLSWSAFHTLQSLTAPDMPCFVRINQWEPDAKKDARIYSSRDHLLSKLSEMLADGKRVFVTSNSKALVLKAAEILAQIEKPDGSPVRAFHVTSENSKSKEAQGFIQNIKQEILDYDVVLASPSLGTGVDISFPEQAQLVDAVVGLFVGGVTDHRDIDQQLLRVRNPKEVHLWIDPVKDTLETDYDAILDDLRERHLQSLVEGNFSTEVTTEKDSFISMVARIVRDRHHSLNLLKLNFLTYKEQQGWNLVFEAKDTAASKAGRQNLKTATERIHQRRVQEILDAPCLSLYEFLRVEDRINKIQLPIAQSLRNAYYRTRMERFYKQDLTAELIDRDLSQTFRKKLGQFKRLNDHKYIEGLFIGSTDLKSDLSANLIRESIWADQTLARILMNTPLYQNCKFLTGVEVTKDDLADFCKESEELKQALRTHLGVKIPDNLRAKPTRFLNKLLDMAGLNLIKTRSSSRTGTKQYFYAIDDGQLDILNQTLNSLTQEQEVELAEHYPDMADRYGIGWCYITAKYGHTFNSGETNWMFPGRDSVGEFIPRRILHGHEKWAAKANLG